MVAMCSFSSYSANFDVCFPFRLKQNCVCLPISNANGMNVSFFCVKAHNDCSVYTEVCVVGFVVALDLSQSVFIVHHLGISMKVSK